MLVDAILLVLDQRAIYKGASSLIEPAHRETDHARVYFYLLAINSIADNGAIDAAYFNPYPIHVGNAVASRDGNVTKLFVELRDVNYPGSTYSLSYDPAGDRLQGTYYQAVEQQRFEVVFERMSDRLK